MPELPEVQTTVDGINKEIRGLTILDIWTDYRSSFHAGKENIKNPRYFSRFKKEVIGNTVIRAERKGKNVLIHLSNKKTVLVHMKMTGHFLFGNYSFDGNKWVPSTDRGPFSDPFNRHIRLVFTVSEKNSGKKHLAFSDLRKFAKVFLFNTNSIHTIENLMHLGPDPLTDSFTVKVMTEQLLRVPRGKIKQVLMNQHIISGIGNIYSDEMLWKAGIHPLSLSSKIPTKELKKLHTAMRAVLSQGIDFGGDSDSDYRNIYGEPGKYQHTHNAYRRTGELCPKKDGGVIERIRVAGRSGHFCSIHQVLFK